MNFPSERGQLCPRISANWFARTRLSALRFRSRSTAAIPACFLALTLTIHAQPATAHIGYVYPAGGRQGATFQVVVGGQFLNGATNVFVSGDGIRAAVVEYNRPMNQKEFNELRDKLKELQDKRRAARQAPNSTNVWTGADEMEIAQIRARILKNPPHRQGNPAIAETVLVQVALAANAEPGDRELRLGTPTGLSNPLVFRVGQLLEFSKLAAKPSTPELDRLRKQFGLPPENPSAKSELRVALPAVLNGQIMPGGVDRYRFTAHQGQHLVVAASARQLIPYLADAVPGWFQATLALYDAKGNELVYDDRYRFRPDPVFYCAIPRSGEYVVEIKDSLYRGREDFVYRLALGELPFVTSIFPLGCQEGVAATVEFKGWNLPAGNLTQDAKSFVVPPLGGSVADATPDRVNAELRTAITQEVSLTTPGIYQLSVTNDGRVSNPVPFAVDTLPECLEREPNNAPANAQPVTLPVIVNGRVDQPGDWDVFRFEGRAGDQIAAEIYARRLDSPLDSLLRLTDAAGRQLAFNDDHEDKGSGLNTHHADSYLAATLPADGTYYLHLGDTQRKGGAEFGYRLRISPPQPDFALRVVPSSLNVRAGMSVPLSVYALRKDGFTNEITLILDDAPAGFALSGNRVPANQDQARLTLKAPLSPSAEPVALSLKGFAFIGGHAVFRPAVPAEDMMQAFAYRHLVPAKELRVAVLENRRPMAMAGVRILSATPVKIPADGTASVRIATPTSAFANRFELELNGPPDGITLQSVSPVGEGVEIGLKCDAAKVKPGLKGNLIVNVLPGKNQPPAQKKQKPGNQRRAPVGTLPAIPFEIIPQQ